MARLRSRNIDWTPDLLETVFALRRQGKTISEISEVTLLPKQSIYLTICKYKVKSEVKIQRGRRKSIDSKPQPIRIFPSQPQEPSRGDIIIEVVRRMNAGADLHQTSLKFKIPCDEITEAVARHRAVASFEKNLMKGHVFAPRFTVPPYHLNGTRARLTQQQIIDFLRGNSIFVKINETDGHCYVNGAPVNKQGLVEIANEFRRIKNLPDISMKPETKTQKGY